MYLIQTTNRFEKDVLKCKKRGLDLALLKEVMSILADTGKLPDKYNTHKLTGKNAGCSFNFIYCFNSVILTHPLLPLYA